MIFSLITIKFRQRIKEKIKIAEEKIREDLKNKNIELSNDSPNDP